MIELEPLEAWGRHDRTIDPEIATAINAAGAVRAMPIDPPYRWRLETDSRVGVLVGEGWTLRIRPRLAIPKLNFMLIYSLRPDGWRDQIAQFGESDDVVEALASGFATHAERALEQGLLRGYVAIEETRTTLRGRIRFGDQLTRSRGLPLPLEVSYDDFTADIAENRLLRTAAEALLVLRRVPARARGQLLRVRALLDEVSVLPDRRAPELPAITRLNARYESALRLAHLILRHRSFAQESGKLAVTSFLFDMNEIFESFVYIALRESLRSAGGTVERQVPGALDEAERPRLRFLADIVWRRGGQVRAVIDSKYKSLYAGGSMPNADAYQMLAYCIGYGLDRGFLVYARDTQQRPRSHVIKRHGYVIDVRAVDVEEQPEQVLAQIDEIAAAIVESAAAERSRPLAGTLVV